MRMRSIVCGLVSAVTLCGSSPELAAHRNHELPDSGAAAVDGVAEYVDVSGYLTSDADIDAWYTLVANLKRNFDDICGDTFCEGDYSNIESLRYRCSVERATGTIGSCVWVFAASNEEVNLRTGKVIVDVEAWRCRSPLARGTSIHDFLNALSGPTPLYAQLPATMKTIYEGLGACL